MLFRTNHSIFVVAHPDDVELFAFRSLVNAIKLKHKITIIILTAGDDGKGNQCGSDNSYWKLRVNGQKNALKFLLHRIADTPITEKHFDTDTWHTSLNNLSIYNLKLPDQRHHGQFKNENQLTLIERNQIDFISTIDNLKKYTKSDVIKKIREIITIDSGIFQEKHLHITSLSTQNSNDHTDHRAASKLAIDATKNLIKHQNIHEHQTYNNIKENINMSTEEQFLHAAVWGIYNSKIQSEYPELSGRLQTVYIGKEYIIK